jgi:hypothetical protein
VVVVDVDEDVVVVVVDMLMEVDTVVVEISEVVISGEVTVEVE